MYVYDLNTYITSDATLVSLSGKTSLTIQPAVGYESTGSPTLIYWYNPGFMGTDFDEWRKDRVRYMILDTDSDRCIALGERVISLLNQGPKIRFKINSVPNGNLGKFAFVARGSLDSPTIKEGFYRFNIECDISWTPSS